MRSTHLRTSMLVVATSLLTGCRGASGALGMHWGDNAATIATRVGAPCKEWSPWRSTDFEYCENFDHLVNAYGGKAYLQFYRKGQRLEGVGIRFADGSWHDIRTAALKDLPLSRSTAEDGSPYQVFSDDSLVRVEDNRGEKGFTIVVASPAFGKPYAAAILREGMGGLFQISH